MRKAIIAMSGGVDSSVAALLTKETGDECIGATMKLFHNEDIGVKREKTCCSLDDVEDARNVCYRMPRFFKSFDIQSDFSEILRPDAPVFQRIHLFFQVLRNGLQRQGK